MPLTRNQILYYASAAFFAAASLLFPPCMEYVLASDQPAEEQRSGLPPRICRPRPPGAAAGQCPRCCAKNVSGDTCEICGHPLQKSGGNLLIPPLMNSGSQPRLKDLATTERGIRRNMRKFDENVRNMKTSINRIRTINRQIGAFRRR